MDRSRNHGSLDYDRVADVGGAFDRIAGNSGCALTDRQIDPAEGAIPR